MIKSTVLIDEKVKLNLGSGLVTLVIGGGVLRVDKATFEHTGQLAGIQQQLVAMKNQNTVLREHNNEIMNTINERTRSRFTSEDADKLI